MAQLTHSALIHCVLLSEDILPCILRAAARVGCLRLSAIVCTTWDAAAKDLIREWTDGLACDDFRILPDRAELRPRCDTALHSGQCC